MNLAPQTSTHPEPTGPTPAQTIGPFFRFGMEWMDVAALVPEGSAGSVVLSGRVLDGAGVPVPDAMVEIWQADADGRLGAGLVEPGSWSGFGRCLTDADGRYRFVTVRPGQTGDGQAPHIDVTLFARGLLQRLVSRVYLPGEPANEDDPVLAALGPERRATLVAAAIEGADGPALEWDVRLQGDGETVFFTW